MISEIVNIQSDIQIDNDIYRVISELIFLFVFHQSNKSM